MNLEDRMIEWNSRMNWEGVEDGGIMVYVLGWYGGGNILGDWLYNVVFWLGIIGDMGMVIWSEWSIDWVLLVVVGSSWYYYDWMGWDGGVGSIGYNVGIVWVVVFECGVGVIGGYGGYYNDGINWVYIMGWLCLFIYLILIYSIGVMVSSIGDIWWSDYGMNNGKIWIENNWINDRIEWMNDKRRMGVYEGVIMNNGDNMNYSMEVWYRYGWWSGMGWWGGVGVLGVGVGGSIGVGVI